MNWKLLNHFYKGYLELCFCNFNRSSSNALDAIPLGYHGLLTYQNSCLIDMRIVKRLQNRRHKDLPKAKKFSSVGKSEIVIFYIQYKQYINAERYLLVNL